MIAQWSTPQCRIRSYTPLCRSELARELFNIATKISRASSLLQEGGAPGNVGLACQRCAVMPSRASSLLQEGRSRKCGSWLASDVRDDIASKLAPTGGGVPENVGLACQRCAVMTSRASSLLQEGAFQKMWELACQRCAVMPSRASSLLQEGVFQKMWELACQRCA